MSDAWNDMRKAKENSYFEKKNQEALARLKQKKDDDKPRLSPITGEAMEQVVMHGVVIDRCTTSGGIWLDAGELEELVDAFQKVAEEEKDLSMFSKFFKSLSGTGD